MYNIMFNMKTVTTRELLHHTKRIQSALARGESFKWTSRGKLVGYLQPAQRETATPAFPDFLERARRMGAVNKSDRPISESLYADRD